MSGFLGAAYLWVKAAHIIFVIFWMAGLFILPRYLVHHQEALGDPVQARAWAEREAKLRRVILTPSIGVVWVLGLALAVNLGLFDGQSGLGWLHAKLLLVFLLSGYHGWAVGYSKKLTAGQGTLDARRLRMINEIPAIFVALIVILAVVRPF
ncbi:CopD family protein [Sphingomonas sp. MG17]|jgi:putative membrane protein|uniref:Protoporphyrinogen IX oxidase n=1 Tax=Sphingomonas tagetis TaxID=2949092 RepID=A0A9X2HQA8_9SPHN|nr:CopD family protein [Sphingomonas tagetis]MCP3731568.1 CopD family protein [Sphingomonas tagetis]